MVWYGKAVKAKANPGPSEYEFWWGAIIEDWNKVKSLIEKIYWFFCGPIKLSGKYVYSKHQVSSKRKLFWLEFHLVSRHFQLGKKKELLGTAGARRQRVPLPCFKHCLPNREGPSEVHVGLENSYEEGYKEVKPWPPKTTWMEEGTSECSWF